MSLIDPWFYDYKYSREHSFTPRQIERMEELNKENTVTRKYTAADFANAQFAEHPNPETVDAQFAARMNTDPTYPWLLDGVPGNTDIAMAEAGWVPVPTKPTITRTEFLAAVDDVIESQYATTEARCQEFTQSLGIEITPDPKPTNTERLEKLLRSRPWGTTSEAAEYLNDHGVTAPKED